MFKLVKEIRSKTGELHFCRWRIIETSWFNIYLHFIAKADEDKHLHNHPWNFISILLLGGYKEQSKTYTNTGSISMIGNKSWFSYVNHLKTFHKIQELIEPTFTLVITGKRQDGEWGYDVDGTFIRASVYREMKNNNQL